MVLTAHQIANLVQGEVVGPGDIVLAGVASLRRARAGELSFINSRRYLADLAHTNATAVLVTPEFRHIEAGPATRIVVSDARHALQEVLTRLYPEPQPSWGIHPTARIGRSARWTGRIAVGPHAVLGDGVHLGAECVIGAHVVLEAGARLGSGCRIGPGAVICGAATLGDRVTVHSGARVGGAGFAFTQIGERWVRTPHLGSCVVETEVELGANTTVDRGSVSDTVIGCGTKVDNLVHIAHNVRVGARCVIMAQAGIAGSSIIEDDVVLAGQAGIADHLRVGQGARVAAQGGVIGDIPAGATVSGYPARLHRDVLRQATALRRLTALVTPLERMVRNARPS